MSGGGSGIGRTTKYPQSMVDAAAGSIRLGRLGHPDEIAWTIAFVASPAGDFVSGAVITVDGARDNWHGAWPPSNVSDDDGNLHAEPRRPAGAASQS